MTPRRHERKPDPAHEHVIPVVEETLEIGKRRVETGRVRVEKRVEEREETVDEPLRRERVEVERVPVGRVVEEAPAVREEDGVTIVPVVEEVLVVEKRLMLKEEVRIRRVEEEFRDPQTVRVRRETAEVDREGDEGRGADGGESSRA